MPESRVVQLAKAIASGTEQLDHLLSEAGHPPLSLSIEDGTSQELPPGEAQNLKEATLAATRELTMLLEGPLRRVQNLAASEYDVAVLHVIHRFQIAQMFGARQTATFGEIAAKSSGKLGEHQVRRLLRYAMTNGLFCEPQPGVVAHTTLSCALAVDDAVIAEAAQLTDEQFGACAHLVEALDKFGDSQEPIESGWSLANKATRPMFEELQAKSPQREAQFSRFLELWARQHPTQPLADDLETMSFPNKPHVVDIGGNKGQDIVSARDDVESIDPEVRGRIQFMTHDFISKVQPVQAADVYLFRSIFHNWSDKYCVQILRNLIPALKPGSRIVLHDLCIAEEKFAPQIERITRGIDLVMMTLFNGSERREEDFVSLFKQADPRFEFVGAREPPVSEMGIPLKGLFSIIEAKWMP